MKDEKRRSLIKAITWRLTGTLDTFLISLLITGSFKWASAISVTEVMTKVGLYYCHERVWELIHWGKIDKKNDVDVLAKDAPGATLYRANGVKQFKKGG